MVSLAAYFSRNALALDLARHGVSIFSTVSILCGGLCIGRQGNLYAVAGAVGLMVGRLVHRLVILTMDRILVSSILCREGSIGPVPALDISNYLLAAANILFLQGNSIE